MDRILLTLAAMFVAMFGAGAAAAQSCPEIKFERGTSSGAVAGQATDAKPRCYRFASGAGQTAHLTLSGSSNACFTIPGVIDCQNDFRFTTQARTYEVGVYQLLRTTGAENFTLRLTIN